MKLRIIRFLCTWTALLIILLALLMVIISVYGLVMVSTGHPFIPQYAVAWGTLVAFVSMIIWNATDTKEGENEKRGR